MHQLESLINKEGLIILGSLIKLNRISQNMSQQALSEGICVPSYLSKIENGEVVPSLDVIELLFQELAIDYCQDYEWLSQMKEQFQLFFEELKLNGFITSGQIFNQLQHQEKKLIHSPLIVDYYLVKLAYYCGTEERDHYNEAHHLLTSINEILTIEQRYQYYFYQGIDHLYYHHDYHQAKHLLLAAQADCQTGQVYQMLAIVNYKLALYYDSFLEAEKALTHFVEETNLVCLAGVHEFQALLAFKLGSVERALELSQRAMVYGKKIHRQDLMLTPMLTTAFILWQNQQLEQMEAILIEFEHLRQTLAVDWPILTLADLLKLNVQSSFEEQVWNELIQNAPKPLHPAILLSKHCLALEKVSPSILLMLVKQYQEGAFRHLLLDEMMTVLLKCYYKKTRQYKEVAQLLEAPMI